LVNAAQLNGNSFCVILENIQFFEKSNFDCLFYVIVI